MKPCPLCKNGCKDCKCEEILDEAGYTPSQIESIMHMFEYAQGIKDSM